MVTNVNAALKAAVLLAGLAAAPALYAHAGPGGFGMMGRGMMGGGMAGRGAGDMSQMPRTCSGMMANGGAMPNAQWTH